MLTAKEKQMIGEFKKTLNNIRAFSCEEKGGEDIEMRSKYLREVNSIAKKALESLSALENEGGEAKTQVLGVSTEALEPLLISNSPEGNPTPGPATLSTEVEPC